MARGRKTGGGSRKGVPNRTTADARAIFAQFVETNAGRVQGLWDQVAEKDPAKALELLDKLSGYILPKLARTELSGEIGVRGRLIISD